MDSTTIPQNTAGWWPKLIVATFILFAFFIGYLVRRAMQTEIDLVSQDYYQKEIAYQQHLNTVAETNKLADQVTITQAATAEQVSLVFPATFAHRQVQGTIHFFRPSAAKLDFELPLQLNADRRQHIRTSHLAKGLWRLQLNWRAAGKSYFMQQNITLE